MKDNSTAMSSLFDRAEDYGNTSLELFKLSAIDKSSDVVASLVSRLAVAVAVVLSFSMLTVGLALWIGDLLESTFKGFLLVGFLFAVIAVLIYLYRSVWIKSPVREAMIAELMEQKALQT